MPTNGEHPSPRHKGGTPPGRISDVWNVVTPMKSVSKDTVDLTARKGTTLQWEQEDPRSESRQAERQRELITGRIGQYLP